MSNIEPSSGGTPAPSGDDAGAAVAKRDSAVKKHVRGSLLLLVGRGVGVLLNLAVQVLLVRALSVSEYGSFAFGLSVAAMGATLVGIGLDKGVSRFVSMYEERGQYGEMAGVIVLSLLLVLATGTSAVGLVYLLSPWLGAVVPDDISLSVLLILVCLLPADALDIVMMQLLAIFASAKALAIRRHIVTPALRLAAVGSLIFFGQSVNFLAFAWVLAVLVSTTLSGLIIFHAVRKRALLEWFRPHSIRLMPGRLLRFSVPLVSSDFSLVVRNQLVPVLLGVLQTASAVASYRAVLPVARLNLFVSEVFKTLFLPAVGRMYAVNDYRGIRELYWGTCAWILVLTYPIFLVTFMLAEPLSILLFGDRYSGSGVIMRWLAVGFFTNAVITNNTISLQQMSGNVRQVVLIDSLTLIAALGLTFTLISAYGALGGAMAHLFTAGVRSVASLALMEGSKGVGLPTRAFVRIATVAFVTALAVLFVEAAFDAPLTVLVPLVGVAAVAVLLRGAQDLNLASTFPELLRIPLIRRMIHGGQRN